MDETEPTEFDQQPPVTDDHGDGGTDLSSADRVKYGMQKRIDALTAVKHQHAAQIEMLQQQLAQQTAAISERLGALQAKPEADPYEDLDPALAKALRYQAAQLEQRFAEQQRKMDAMVMSSQVQQVGQQANLPPEIVSRARSVLEGARKEGIPLNAKDATAWAMGEAILEGKWKPPLPQGAQARAANGQFAPVNQVYSGAMPPPDAGGSRVKPLPANFDSLDADAQLRLLEARGVGDHEL